ncbi:hypothetical protein CBM2629_B20119 [Cupriavidus taiwanensis]|nr:hypothetical protein CBM2629_B20119 [Cupriavidus taiwanensis]
MLPSPACGRGVGGEGRRKSGTVTLHFVVALPSPPPLSQRERGANSLGFSV